VKSNGEFLVAGGGVCGFLVMRWLLVAPPGGIPACRRLLCRESSRRHAANGLSIQFGLTFRLEVSRKSRPCNLDLGQAPREDDQNGRAGEIQRVQTARLKALVGPKRGKERRLINER
jgi:hypothetical protein